MKKGMNNNRQMTSLLGRKVVAQMNCSTDSGMQVSAKPQLAKLVNMNISGVTTISSIMAA